MSAVMVPLNDAASRGNMPKITGDMPRTFVERGVTLPFTTDQLFQARVRKASYGKDKLETVLPGYGANGANYVVDWKYLRELIKMTMHDRLLHERLTEGCALTPREMRVVTREVALTGIAGPEAESVAKDCVETEKRSALLAEFDLTVSMLGLNGVTMDNDPVKFAAMASDKTQVRAAFAEIAKKIGCNPADILEAITRTIPILTPVGFSEAHPGEVRLMMRRLKVMMTIIAHMLETGQMGDAVTSEVGSTAQTTMDCIGLTLRLSQQAIKKIDEALANARNLIGEGSKLPMIKEEADRLSWLLDGWDPILFNWDQAQEAAKRGEKNAIPEAIRKIGLGLPVMPLEEILDKNYQAAAADIGRRAQRRWVRANEDWRTGQTDPGMAAAMRQVAV